MALKDLKIDANTAEAWGTWSSCSATCGSQGTRERSRSCPSGKLGIALCSGQTLQAQTCSLPACSQWAQWANWTKCSVSCGNGTRRRIRKCRKSGNDRCVGSTSQTEICEATQCHGRWEFWGKWGSCSATCGSGVQVRARNCRGGEIGTGFCLGMSKDKRLV